MNLFKKLIPKDSFYMVLFVCIAVVGASAVWVSKGDVKEELNIVELKEDKLKSNKEVKGIVEEEIKLDLNEKDIVRKPKKKTKTKKDTDEQKQDIKNNKKSIEDAEKVKAIEKEQAKAETKPEIVEEVPTETAAVASQSVEVKDIKLKKPVQGNIYKGFSQDKLIYNKTLDEWSTHLGVKIAANEGTEVVAALDGIVKQVINDKKLGLTIILDHSNGLETVYKNISTGEIVKTGQQIKAGEIISKVSKGTGFEKLEDPHLYFEVMQSGKYVNPENYF